MSIALFVTAALLALSTTGVPGADATGAADATPFFQKALDDASAANGGIVDVPSGRYRFDGVLTIPANCTLRGIFAYAPSHAGIRDNNPDQRPEFGTTFEAHAGRGAETGAPFITLLGNATLQGVCVYYPDQDPNAETPAPYPYTVAMRGNNPAIVDVELLNPYNGIDASENQRALVRNVHGQPIHIGIFVDKIYDIGRIENVHWNPWWTMNTPAYKWQTENGIGFLFARTDWHYVINTFCFGYNVGYKFVQSEAGATNGNFLGIGADDCFTSVLVEDTAPMGVLITNGEFVAFHGPDPTMLRVAPTHGGTLRLSNCAFWGPCNRNAVIAGTGTVGLSDCSFMQWGHKDKDAYSVDVEGGSVLVRGCEFMVPKNQIRLDGNVERAVITDNLIAGKKKIQNHAKGNTVIKDNVATPLDGDWKTKLRSTDGYRAKMLEKQGVLSGD